MTYKQNTTALEYGKNDKGSYKKFLMEEAESFANRNMDKDKHYCPRCLKAHILKRTLELGINIKSINPIKILKNSEAGHLGYYLDDGELIKI